MQRSAHLYDPGGGRRTASSRWCPPTPGRWARRRRRWIQWARTWLVAPFLVARSSLAVVKHSAPAVIVCRLVRGCSPQLVALGHRELAHGRYGGHTERH